MTDSKKSYYAIIPANVRSDENLPPNAKLLYGEITALCNSEGYCWASNKYFAEMYGVSPITISRWVNLLASKGYIESQIIYKEGTKEIDKRYIQICCDPLNKNVTTPINEIVKDNNTSINTTDEYINISNTPKQKQFTPPTLEEIQTYCKERKNNVDAKKFYDYYSAAEWRDKNGDKVKSWKQKVITWEGRNKKEEKADENLHKYGGTVL